MNKPNSTFKSISPDEIPERKHKNILKNLEEIPELPELEKHGVIGYSWIEKLHTSYNRDDFELEENTKLAIFQYLRHKSYFIDAGKGQELAEKQYKKALQMSQDMNVFSFEGDEK